jgi:pyruvate/2-oxoglutarate dehydrogenase complex dihydrolipoamide acyltransferase (E2) component
MKCKPANEEKGMTAPVQRETSSSTALTTYSGNVEIIEMDRMRKLIAEHMVRSKQTSPARDQFHRSRCDEYGDVAGTG